MPLRAASLNRPLATAISHLVLVLGVIAVAFPLYITFVASKAIR